MNYVRTTAARHGIDKHVKYHHKVLKMDWKSEHQYWAVDVTANRIEQKIFYARYLVLGTGYYDYDAGLAAVIPGLKNFKCRPPTVLARKSRLHRQKGRHCRQWCHGSHASPCHE